MKLPICGPAYKHPSVDVNFQRCVNMFLMSAGPDGRGENVLVPTAGLSLLTNLGLGPIRAMKTFGDFVYAVSGSSVYKIAVNYLTQSATTTLIGTLGTSFGTVSMASNPTQIIFVDGSTTGYLYTPGTSTFQTINDTDADFPGGVQVKFIDSYFVVNAPDSGRFYFSAPNNGLSWDPLDVATAESGTDNIVGLGVSKDELWVIGSSTIEIWYNAANVSGSPFSPRTALGIVGGCGAADSIVEIDDLLIWLDNRGYIVQSAVSPFIRSNNSGYDLKIISDEAITAEILSYTRRDDAIAMSYNDRGHLMYQITFPTAQKTWVYDYTAQVWHERSYFDSTETYHLGQFATTFGSAQLVSGIRNGKIYLQSKDFLNDAGVPIYRTRVTAPQRDENTFGLIGVDSVSLRAQTGMADQGDDPQISMRFSWDGGHTWSYSMARSLGEVGQYGKYIWWNRLGVGREWIFEFTITDAVEFSLIEAVAKASIEAE